MFKLDTFGAGGLSTGATDTQRSLILPHRAYQVLEEKRANDFRGTRKYVVGKNKKILSYS